MNVRMFLFILNYRRQSVSFPVVCNLELWTCLKTRSTSFVKEALNCKMFADSRFLWDLVIRKMMAPIFCPASLVTNELMNVTKSICLEWHWFLEQRCHSDLKRELLSSPCKTRRIYFLSLCGIVHWGKMFDFFGLDMTCHQMLRFWAMVTVTIGKVCLYSFQHLIISFVWVWWGMALNDVPI